MRSVRCDVCGTRALMAASTCPKCAHPFSVRDGFGQLLPLSHCSTCNSDYPATAGSCRWCGTQPERAPIGPWIWKGVGIAAFVSMAWGAWMVHDDAPSSTPKERLEVLLKPDSSAAETDSAVVSQTLASAGGVDTTVRDTSTSVVATDTAAAQPVSTGGSSTDSVIALQSAGAVAEPEPVPPSDTPVPVRPVVREPVREPAREVARESVRPPVRAPSSRAAVRAPVRAPARVAVRPPAKATSRVAVAPKPSARSRKAVRWTNSVARNWVIVRSDPTRRSRIIASIGPNTRVQLGEARGDWRRIKAKGLSGWVEHRLFFAGAGVPSRGGRLAAR